MTNLAWPIALIALAVLAYRFGLQVLKAYAEAAKARALADTDRVRIDQLAATQRELEVAFKQMRNVQTMSRKVTGI